MSRARLAATVLAAVLMPTATAAAATPSVVGWPVATPAGELLPGVGREGAVVNATLQGISQRQVLTAYRPDLRRRWSQAVDLGDNRGDAPTVTRANADGSYGPVGVLGLPGVWNVDATGKRVLACWGPVLADGSCIEARLSGSLTADDPLQYVVLRRPASGDDAWRVPTGSCCEDLRSPVLDDTGTVYSSLPLPGVYRLRAINAASGHVRWTRDVTGPVMAALQSGVLTAGSVTVDATDDRGAARWRFRPPEGRATTAAIDRRGGDVMIETFASNRTSASDRYRVYSVSLATGRVRWSRAGHLLGVGATGTRYVTVDGVTLRALARDGALRWSRAMFSGVVGVREQRDGTVLVSVGSDLGLLYRLDPRRPETAVSRSSVTISRRRTRVPAFQAPGCLVGGGTVLRLRLSNAVSGRVGYRSGFSQSGPDRTTIHVFDRFRLPAGTHFILVPVAEGRQSVTVDWRENGRLVTRRFAVTGMRCPA